MSYLLGDDGPVAVIPGRVARLIERVFPDIKDLRIAARGSDYSTYQALDALHRAALAWRTTATGKAQEPERESARRSLWMSSTQAAAYLHIGERAIRVACAQQRIPAEKVDGRWRISVIDLENYKAAHEQERP
ncbi:helix-turn-helix domain-containing protein [Curtobacterium sp. ISL-83]|uniref:helix-turn-helix domain-containing protein n=1 Tax=Curtobacterium sp. ISL-83 TaxID=2819145 RepID=UPI001BE870DE|nr:helix-turn-helix domain-containing protein [Curtobacterium sp. ISL-83]MBT2501421.1 helix-turn-helix domain-containing protein [Curtobacterium sp. ISL-83]